MKRLLGSAVRGNGSRCAARHAGWPSRPWLAVVAAGLAVAAGGCGGDDDGDDQTEPVRLPPTLVDTTLVEGGSSEQRFQLQRAVSRMDETTLRQIAIGEPEEGRDEEIAITFTPVKGDTVRRQWDEWIVAGAFSRRLRADVYATDGERAFPARPKVEGQPDPRPLRRAREKAIVRGIRTAAKARGNRVRLTVHRPYGVAVTVFITSDNPAAYLKNELSGLLAQLQKYRARLEGVYVAVLDERQRLALEWGSWTRNPAGAYWVRHDLTRCSPIRQSAPPGTDPPPDCPV